MKQKRHAAILRAIARGDIKTQEQLTEEFKSAGYLVTQATVSRDIKELGLIKISSASGGYKYAARPEVKRDANQHLNVFSNAVISVESAMHTIVVKTYSGMAPAVAATVDELLGTEIVGSIAGDDTILLIMESPEAAKDMCGRLEGLFSRKGLEDA